MSIKSNMKALPIAPLKVIAMDNCLDLCDQINSHIIKARKDAAAKDDVKANIAGFVEDSYLANYHMVMHHTGERQAVIDESIRGTDLFIITDVVNREVSYDINGTTVFKTPDEHFQDLKRIIGACHGTAHRINVIMPYLYEGRYNNRRKLESLDCALALKDMINMGISNIITFDAHEPRVQNAIPIQGIDNFPTSFQFIQAIINGNEGINFDKDSLLIVSPDVGGMSRVVFYSTILGVNMGMFYQRKNYSEIVNGENPVVAVEFLGGDITGKDIIIVDDMIDTGKSIINTAKELKKRGAGKIIMAATFGLFTKGLDIFDEAYESGLFDRLYTTNLTYCSDELKSKPYYKLVDMSSQLAELIITINYDASFSNLVDQTKQIKELLNK